ncbi:cobalt-precorrin-6A reductase [Cognatishimia sp. SS12]|uniref:cobalt-precorrin-6A reductase n=1 Tax=Cognatishimia sp. SS12 TaxID=2979465 RepID=UPI00232B481D|nr:cobalt-precorrin-6A reductase [Cognatishimia sp. SS12]MDC0736670.1 cobalt-precorrin-6A reductase [Cognatishimia sp. SS12]
MAQHLLILGGTSEASALAARLAQENVPAIFSYAGRVARPRAQPLPTRHGGFGGVKGLAAFLRDNAISHVVDATHPFAAQMSWNAYHACAELGVPLAALTRPAWQPQAGDMWQQVPDIPAAVAALSGPAERIMLALGRMHLAAFQGQPQHHYVLRLVDAPDAPPPLPHHTVTVARGPFAVADDIALFREHGIDRIVCKNAGGSGAEAKLHAARALGLPVVMIDRPGLPPRDELATPGAVMDWLADHPATERGV